MSIDRILAVIDQGLAAVPADDTSYEPFGTEAAELCWRCVAAPLGEGVTGLCGSCREEMLDESNPPAPVDNETRWSYWDALGDWLDCSPVVPGVPRGRLFIDGVELHTDSWHLDAADAHWADGQPLDEGTVMAGDCYFRQTLDSHGIPWASPSS